MKEYVGNRAIPRAAYQYSTRARYPRAQIILDISEEIPQMPQPQRGISDISSHRCGYQSSAIFPGPMQAILDYPSHLDPMECEWRGIAPSRGRYDGCGRLEYTSSQVCAWRVIGSGPDHCGERHYTDRPNIHCMIPEDKSFQKLPGSRGLHGCSTVGDVVQRFPTSSLSVRGIYTSNDNAPREHPLLKTTVVIPTAYLQAPEMATVPLISLARTLPVDVRFTMELGADILVQSPDYTMELREDSLVMVRRSYTVCGRGLSMTGTVTPWSQSPASSSDLREIEGT